MQVSSFMAENRTIRREARYYQHGITCGTFASSKNTIAFFGC
jgi:hypothetical protein